MGFFSGLINVVTAPLTAPAKVVSVVSGAAAKVVPNQLSTTIADNAKRVSISQNRIAQKPATDLKATLAQPGGRKRAWKNTLSGGVGWGGDALANERGVVGWGGRKAQKISSNGNKAAPYVAGAVATVYGGPVLAGVAKSVTGTQVTRKVGQELAPEKVPKVDVIGHASEAGGAAPQNAKLSGPALLAAAVAAKLFLFS